MKNLHHLHHLFLIVLFSLLCLPTGKPDLAADRAALLALRSAVGGRSLLWNISQPSPCLWVGVVCEADRVTELRLPGMGLSGQILPGTVGNLTRLHTLSLRFNALSGPLPSDLSSVSDLRNLYLQQNLFFGPIPDVLFSLHNLVKLNLASNNFSGSIPPAFNNLNRLGTLYLQNNHLTGSIPDLNLPSLQQFNVSFNQLNGPVPSRLSGRPSSEFAGNSLCGGPLQPCNGTSNGGGKKLSGAAISGIVIGSVMGFLLIVVILILLCRKKSFKDLGSKEVAAVKQAEVEIPREKPADSGGSVSSAYSAMAAVGAKEKGGNDVGGGRSLVFFRKSGRNFDLDDLLRASAEVLGKGTFGTAYKAVLEMGTVAAVKRLKEVTVPEKEFREKMEGIGAIDHENLVPLRAYFYSNDEKLLVYDYMPMGSLSALLHGEHFFANFFLGFYF